MSCLVCDAARDFFGEAVWLRLLLKHCDWESRYAIPRESPEIDEISVGPGDGRGSHAVPREAASVGSI